MQLKAADLDVHLAEVIPTDWKRSAKISKIFQNHQPFLIRLALFTERDRREANALLFAILHVKRMRTKTDGKGHIRTVASLTHNPGGRSNGRLPRHRTALRLSERTS